MSDPIGSNAPQAKPQDELALIYQGGSNFMARMEAMDKRRREHDEAYLKLKIGGDAKAAYEDATEKRKQAEAAHAEALKVLENAKAEAAGLLRAANADAEAVRDAVRKEAKASGETSDSMRRGADKYVADAKAKADAVTSDLKAKQQALDASLREVTKRAADQDAAIEAASVARKGAADKEAKLQAKIDRLHEVIREIAGG